MRIAKKLSEDDLKFITFLLPNVFCEYFEKLLIGQSLSYPLYWSTPSVIMLVPEFLP